MAASRRTSGSSSRSTSGINSPSGSNPDAGRQNQPKQGQQKRGASSSAQASQSSTPEIQMTLNHDQIAQRAFAIWVAKGKPMGQDQQNWSDAERQLRQELARRA